jgi:hypothetical protein
VRAHIEKLGIDHEYIDIRRDKEAARFLRERAAGKEKTPTLDIAGTILVDPSDEEYNNRMREKGISRDQRRHMAKQGRSGLSPGRAHAGKCDTSGPVPPLPKQARNNSPPRLRAQVVLERRWRAGLSLLMPMSLIT